MLKAIGDSVVNSILDKGLARSTWRDNYPEAYEALLAYRLDMQKSANLVLSRKLKKQNAFVAKE